jgi:hypothetical protein
LQRKAIHHRFGDPHKKPITLVASNLTAASAVSWFSSWLTYCRLAKKQSADFNGVADWVTKMVGFGALC